MLSQRMQRLEINHYPRKAKDTKPVQVTTIHHMPTSGGIPTRFLAKTPQPLDRAFNRAVHHIVSKLLPNGFDVSDSAPSSLIGLRAHYEATGRICVWSGGSDRTIFADAETNYAFRAWHDYHHLTGEHDFTPDGELSVACAQSQDIYDLYGLHHRWADILHAEIIGQGEYERANGVFPNDQMAFVRAYLIHPENALRQEF